MRKITKKQEGRAIKEELLKILRCPKCKTELDLKETIYELKEIKSGILICKKCQKEYKIINFIPLMVDTLDPCFQKLETVKQWGRQWAEENFIKNSKYYSKELLDLELQEWGLPDKNWFEGKKILDAGCGNGRHCLIFKRFKFACCVAFDLSGSVYYMLHKKEFEGIHLVRADIMNPPFEDGYFDFVLARQTLQHTKNAGLATKVLTTTLRQEGYFVSSFYKTPEKFTTLCKLRLIQLIRKILSIFPERFVYYFTWLSIPCYKYKILYPIARLIFIQSKYDKSDSTTWGMNHDQYINSYQNTYTREEVIKFLNDAYLYNHIESREWPNMFCSTKK
ncbi:MAG: methyltransferase domain-containing protein [Candidatus Hydrogenedentota bacterium]